MAKLSADSNETTGLTLYVVSRVVHLWPLHTGLPGYSVDILCVYLLTSPFLSVDG